MTDETRPTTNAASIAYRRARRRGRRVSLLGLALVGYGIIGIAIFAFVATSINRPLERVLQLTQSVERQRRALVNSRSRPRRRCARCRRRSGGWTRAWATPSRDDGRRASPSASRPACTGCATR